MCELEKLVKHFFSTFIVWRTNSYVLIQAISGCDKWYSSTKSGVFQNLCTLSQYTKAYQAFHICFSSCFLYVLYVTYNIVFNLTFLVPVNGSSRETEMNGYT